MTQNNLGNNVYLEFWFQEESSQLWGRHGSRHLNREVERSHLQLQMQTRKSQKWAKAINSQSLLTVTYFTQQACTLPKVPSGWVPKVQIPQPI